MAEIFEFPASDKLESPEDGEDLGRHDRGSETHHWPLITPEENQFIENTGGAYAGFVERGHGREQFEDFRVDRRAYYDQHERAVIEAFVTTEGVNDEGGNELGGPSDITGFMLMIVRRSRSGQELGRADIISLQAKDFPGKQLSLKDLRLLAGEMHDFVLAEAPKIEHSELRRRVEGRLSTEGWRTN